jgi:hypothetical protein
MLRGKALGTNRKQTARQRLRDRIAARGGIQLPSIYRNRQFSLFFSAGGNSP